MGRRALSRSAPARRKAQTRRPGEVRWRGFGGALQCNWLLSRRGAVESCHRRYVVSASWEPNRSLSNAARKPIKCTVTVNPEEIAETVQAGVDVFMKAYGKKSAVEERASAAKSADTPAE